MSILKWQVNFRSDFSSFSSSFFIFHCVITHNFSVRFLLWTKGSHKIIILTLSSVLIKICQILHVVSQTTSLFFFKFCMTVQCHEIPLPCTFYVKYYILCTKATSQSARFLVFLVPRSKFTKFLSFLKHKIEFSSNFMWLFSIMRHSWSLYFF